MLNEFCDWCNEFLWTIFIVPTFTAMLLSYDGQSEFLVWSAIIIEMIMLYFIVRMIISAIMNVRKKKRFNIKK